MQLLEETNVEHGVSNGEVTSKLMCMEKDQKDQV